MLQEERQYLLNIKQIKSPAATCCSHRSIQGRRGDLAHHFLAKMKIMVIKDVEREDIEYVCKSLNVRPSASLADHSQPTRWPTPSWPRSSRPAAAKWFKIRCAEPRPHR